MTFWSPLTKIYSPLQESYIPLSERGKCDVVRVIIHSPRLEAFTKMKKKLCFSYLFNETFCCGTHLKCHIEMFPVTYDPAHEMILALIESF